MPYAGRRRQNLFTGNSQASVCLATSRHGTMRSVLRRIALREAHQREQEDPRQSQHHDCEGQLEQRSAAEIDPGFHSCHLTASSESDRFVQQIVQADDLAVDPMMFHQFAELLLAVRAGSDTVPGAGGANLLGFGPSTDDHSVRLDLVNRDQAATAAATNVFPASGNHLHEALAECSEQLARLIDDPPAARQVARIVVGHAFPDGVRMQFQGTPLPGLMGILDNIDDRQGVALQL